MKTFEEALKQFDEALTELRDGIIELAVENGCVSKVIAHFDDTRPDIFDLMEVGK